jgi:PKD repeat protein
MKKILSSILFLIISIAAFAQVGPNDLIIQGYVSNSQTSFAVSNWPVTISGMGMTETVYTNANGFYSDTISNGSETGPNQLFVIQTLNCDSSDVTDSVSNNQGTIDIATVNFQICAQNSNTCQALFNFNTSNIMATRQINFESTSTSIDPIATYQWSVDGTPISNNNNFFYLFPDNGGTVCLTVVSSSGCSDTYCQYVDSALCLPFFNYQASANNALEYTFTNTTSTTGQNATYYWYFGDGANSSQASPTHVYNQAGTYSVCLQVITEQCQNSMCQNITVVNDTTAGNGCIANFTYLADSTTIQFNNNSYTPSQPVTFTWNFNDGTFSNELFPVHTYSNPGVYQVCLDVSTPTCSDSYCLQVYAGVSSIYTSCNAQFSYSGPQVADSSYQFIGVSNDESAYHLWTFGDGTSSTLEMPFHSYDVNGIYSVCHIVGINETCADTVCSIVNYFGSEPQCDAAFNVIDNSNFTATIRAVSLPTPGAVYTWSISGPGYENIPFSGPQFLFTPVPNEPYYVCLDYINTETGCSASKCDTIVVQGILDNCSAEFTYMYDGYNLAYVEALPQYFLTSNSYIYSVYSTVYGNGVSNQVPGNAATLTIPSNAGTVTITLNVTNTSTGCNETVSKTFVVSSDTANLAPCNAQFSFTGPLTADSSYQFIGVANDSSAYHLWTFGDGSSSTLEMPFHSYEVNGSYSVCHIVGINEACADTVCSVFNYFGTEPQCDAVFNVIDNGNGTFTVSPLSPPTPSAVITWVINGPGFNGSTLAGYPYNFNYPSSNYPISICMTYSNAETGCVANYCDTIVNVGIVDSCSAELTTGNGSNGWPEFNVNGSGLIASYNWNMVTYNSNGTALEFFNSIQSNASIPAGTAYSYIVVSLAITFETGCQWSGGLIYTSQPDTSITCNASIQYSYVGDVPNPSMFPYQFYSAYSGDIAEVIHSWTTSDGQTSSSYSPLFGFAPGTYTVCHTVSDVNGLCSDSTCISLTVVPDTLNGCTALFSIEIINIATYEYAFTNVSSDLNASFIWQFGDGSTESGVNATHDFTNPGLLPVTLSMTGNGCFDEYTYNLTILPNLPF